MDNFENKYYQKGYKNIVGIDEVGRGCFFGDVVACAIIMPHNVRIEEVRDSKKLTPLRREKLYDIILDAAKAVGIGRVPASRIDAINIKNATHEAMLQAVDNLRDKENNKVEAEVLFVDAEVLPTDILQESIIKGDEVCYSIACASIVAKVYRDRLCQKWGNFYPEYEIEKHKGYGTKKHRELIVEMGPTNMHRYSFLKKLLGEENAKRKL